MHLCQNTLSRLENLIQINRLKMQFNQPNGRF